MKTKVGVVVLNYMNYEETMNCVCSFLNQTYDSIYIVIVDNGSKNESFIRLKEEYDESVKVYIIGNKENVGFARGNNIGIKYCRDILGCEYVFVINSDTIVSSKIVEELIRSDEEGVGVLVPSVQNPDGEWQQPSVNTDDIKKTVKRKYWEILLMLLLENSIVDFIRDKKHVKRKRNLEIKAKNYYLQGCAYMLTPAYFLKYRGLYPKTFLYWEELNLLWYLMRADLNTKYVHTSPVVHKGGASSRNGEDEKKTRRIRHRRVLKGMIASTPLYFANYEKIKKKFDCNV